MIGKTFKFVVLLPLFGVTLASPANSTVQDVAPKIAGGEVTDISHNPWQLALLYTSRHFCGAVAIHPQWALTAAHCLEGADIDNLSIRAGSTTKSFGGQIIDITRIYIHPEYNRRLIDYDFALLELAEPITIQTAAPIALPEPNQDVLEGKIVFITGWGLSSEETSPENLHIVEVPVVGNERCQRSHQHNTITNRMFCTGDVVFGGINACEGDSGGPVIVDGRLVGIVSWGWGRGCGAPDSPAVHAKVSSVLEWIYSTSGI